MYNGNNGDIGGRGPLSAGADQLSDADKPSSDGGGKQGRAQAGGGQGASAAEDDDDEDNESLFQWKAEYEQNMAFSVTLK